MQANIPHHTSEPEEANRKDGVGHSRARTIIRIRAQIDRVDTLETLQRQVEYRHAGRQATDDQIVEVNSDIVVAEIALELWGTAARSAACIAAAPPTKSRRRSAASGAVWRSELGAACSDDGAVRRDDGGVNACSATARIANMRRTRRRSARIADDTDRGTSRR